ncbi:MAG: Crp/Fnr family transcriptional regulator [Flavobacteriales bacterium]|nr:Crp/Fnr family transcriptional regulator [Flavobacteriales bacterium]
MIREIINKHPESSSIAFEKGLLNMDLEKYVYLIEDGTVFVSRKGVVLRSKCTGSLLLSRFDFLGKVEEQNEYFSPNTLLATAIPYEIFWGLCQRFISLKEMVINDLEKDHKEVSFRLRILKHPKKYKLVLWLIQHGNELNSDLETDHISFLTEYLSISKANIMEYLSNLERRRLIRVAGNSIIVIDPRGLNMTLKFGS